MGFMNLQRQDLGMSSVLAKFTPPMPCFSTDTGVTCAKPICYDEISQISLCCNDAS